MKFNKLVMAFVVAGLLLVPSTAIIAQTQTDDENLLERLQELLQQVRALQDQLAELEAQRGDVQQELNETLQLTRTLSVGMSGEDVETLQEILATDPEIYPEGLTTGFFGPLTEKAVKNFQKKFGIEQVGVFGPKTRAKMNQILTEGAGNSGQVPPGLLIAPGIAKKLGETPSPLPGQKLPPGIAKKLGQATSTDEEDDEEEQEEEEDVTAPEISNINSEVLATSSARIEWETNEDATGKVFYSIDDEVEVGSTTTKTISSNKLDDNQEVTIEDLIADTVYFFFIEAKDEADNIATSTIESFETLPEEE